ncbi:MAG TPA: hypothetical protein VFJ85_00700 [Acidimicrobiales bacterium]|nr:hypothetical protein [Acidimicrobiales bacterium]
MTIPPTLRRVLRLLLTGCSLVVAVVVVLFVLLATGLGGFRGGSVWAPALAAAALAAVGRAGWRQRRGRVAVAVALAVAGLVLGTWAARTTPMSAGRLKAEISGIDVPPSFVKAGDQASGNSLCFDVCPSFSRRWFVAATVEEAREQVGDALAGDGFVLYPWVAGFSEGSLETSGRRGRMWAAVTVDPPSVSNGVPPGHVGVTVTLGTV